MAGDNNADRLLAVFDDAYEQPLPIATAVLAEGAATFAWANAAPESRFEFGSIGKTMTAQVLLTFDAEANVGALWIG